ncbi:unnamed protein product [Lactuca virosa]|uniref:Uncharacterized protein n=1 Tax=Lactuca virosa TaxID=75947 RepID=A0AAU9PYE3_9ASTR|nr:unnamed protein product [Lactuca virosa]
MIYARHRLSYLGCRGPKTASGTDTLKSETLIVVSMSPLATGRLPSQPPPPIIVIRPQSTLDTVSLRAQSSHNQMTIHYRRLPHAASYLSLRLLSVPLTTSLLRCSKFVGVMFNP